MARYELVGRQGLVHVLVVQAPRGPLRLLLRLTADGLFPPTECALVSGSSS